jgi:hypothetical protein
MRPWMGLDVAETIFEMRRRDNIRLSMRTFETPGNCTHALLEEAAREMPWIRRCLE